MKRFNTLLFSASSLIGVPLFSAMSIAADHEILISIDTDTAQLIQSQYAKEVPMTPHQQFKGASEGISLVSIPAASMPELSKIMHEDFDRCGGFFFHESKAAATKVLSESSESIARKIDYSINNSQTVEDLLSSLTTSNLNVIVNQLTSYHNRYYSQESGAAAAT